MRLSVFINYDRFNLCHSQIERNWTRMEKREDCHEFWAWLFVWNRFSHLHVRLNAKLGFS